MTVQDYTYAISDLSYRLRNNFPSYEWEDAEDNLKIWKNEKNKHDVENYYDDFIFGICYAQKLFRSRMLCFVELLKNLQEIDDISSILKMCTEITSFGCGPGPEIAAYIYFIREILQCNSFLKITAVDQLEYWKHFINEIAQIDSNVQIKFKNKTLNLEYIRNIQKSEVCIMSYPHAMKFEDIWYELKFKFSLIVVIDQAKYSLLRKVNRFGYRTVEFQSLGKKIFFYYLNETTFFPQLCERGEHELNGCIENCLKLVDKTLLCGHTIEVKCYQFDESMTCLKLIKKKCKRNIHEKSVQCGSNVICTEIYEHTFSCGHTGKFQCCDKLNECSEKVKFQLKCGHFIKIFCGSYESMERFGFNDNRIDYKCSEIVQQKLKCGHNRKVKCYQMESFVLCTEYITKFCDRGLHQKSYKCNENNPLKTIPYEKFICNEPFEFKLDCGHFQEIECSSNDALLKSLKCIKKVNKLCNRRIHRHVSLCHEIVICQMLCEKTLQCGHSIIVSCNEYNLEDRKFCQKEFNVICENGLHENKLKCKNKFSCPILISITLLCGHNINKLCGEINYASRFQIQCNMIKECGHQCFTKCVCQMFKFKPITRYNETNNEIKNSCEHGNETFCHEICSKQLVCGHYCQRICKKCQNGKLHKECIEKCLKLMKCGHECKSQCHQDNCWECIENCFTNKFKNFSVFNKINFMEIKRDWIELKSQLSNKAKIEIQLYLNNIIFLLDTKSYSQFWLMQYRITKKFMEKVINFYNLVLNHKFSSVLNKYADYLLISLTNLIKWLDPAKRNISKSINKDFIWEYSRLEDIYVLLTVYSNAINAGKIEDSSKYQKCMDYMILVKYSYKIKKNLIDEINLIRN